MPGPIIHLVIADKILRRLPEGIIKNAALFYCGSLVPDAVHAREGYIRAHKKHSHLTTGIPGVEFYKQENLLLFRERLASFLSDYMIPGDRYEDLSKGYAAHVITDELLYSNLREQMKFFSHDTELILYKNYEFLYNIVDMLLNECDYEIKGYVSNNEIEISKKWVIETFLNNKAIINDAINSSTANLLEFADMASDEIIRRLSLIRAV
jgi:hypothetical protein